ncbi:hypothetical protein GCM10022252_45470 [Streptosporangium oxazolinicum]|uniref:Uncharacterized protein n=1 Tax=Streptosporangium oxazolinicum TaxID=909287 RepID=A0ABP8B397_9ACTN
MHDALLAGLDAARWIFGSETGFETRRTDDHVVVIEDGLSWRAELSKEVAGLFGRGTGTVSATPISSTSCRTERFSAAPTRRAEIGTAHAR